MCHYLYIKRKQLDSYKTLQAIFIIVISSSSNIRMISIIINNYEYNNIQDIVGKKLIWNKVFHHYWCLLLWT